MIRGVNEKLALILTEISKEINITKVCEEVSLGRDTFYRIRGNKNKKGIDITTFCKLASLLRIKPYILLIILRSWGTDLIKIYSFLGRKQQNRIIKKYFIKKNKLSTKLKRGIESKKEYGYLISHLFPEGEGLNKRSFERIRTNKEEQQNFSLESYLLVCERLSLDTVKIMKEIMEEEG